MGNIRNVQKTGDMHYIYLPTSWFKENKIGSKVMLSKGPAGTLVISPKIAADKAKHIVLGVDETDINILNKLIVACYINPATSFKINLEKKMDFSKILEQKQLVTVEFLDLEGNTIKCDSGILRADPEELLRTMLNKVKNLIMVLLSNPNSEQIEKYEAEIDKSKLLIDKAVIAALTLGEDTKSSIIDLHYTALISRHLERVADHIIRPDIQDSKFFNAVLAVVDNLKNLIESKQFDYKATIKFAKLVQNLGDIKIKDISSYEKRRVQRNLNDISEILLDKSITNEVEKK